MDFIFSLLDRMVGPETELIELLPLLVLVAVMVALRYLRSLILKLFVEIGELKNLIGMKQLIEDLKKDKSPAERQIRD